MRTYYDVLGVAEDTPPVVIKAAFRALAKEYHPDGSAEAADTNRFIELQQAYAVLSDPEARDAYDLELRDAAQLNAMPPAAAPEGAPEAYWPVPPPAVVDIQRICARLSLYSDNLATAFQEDYLHGRCDEDPQAHAIAMEKSFFRDYFGTDEDVQALAKLLLIRSRTNAALTLNELVAGAAPPELSDVRRVVAQIVEQHCGDDPLFAEWLKVKFGLAPLASAVAAQTGSVEAERPTARKPERRGSRSKVQASGGTLRSFVLLCLWALALYFTLFAALPLVQ